jgi:hypothetical protein
VILRPRRFLIKTGGPFRAFKYLCTAKTKKTSAKAGLLISHGPRAKQFERRRNIKIRLRRGKSRRMNVSQIFTNYMRINKKSKKEGDV